MANKQTLAIRHSKTFVNASAANLDTATNAEANTLGGNTIGVTDVLGALTGTQTVLPNTVAISPTIPYLDAVPALNFTATVTWTEVTQLT